ncbi:MAG: hypothetical protein NZ811_04965, partial [Gammaproteobacteria bacterium]|nr:hypothetical protein [Gammaproteobacteria bacterium]
DVTHRKFVGWLQGAPYTKSIRESYQHAQQVFTIFNMIGDGENMLDLFSEEMIRTNWMNKWITIRQPGTIRSYLSSLNLFYEYCLLTGTEKSRVTEIVAVQQIMKVYSKALRKKICTRRTVIETQEIGMY